MDAETPRARLRLDLRRRHVQQLSQIGDNYKLEKDSSPDDPVTPDTVIEWTKLVQAQFDKAVAQQVFGQKDKINWDNAILTFLESCAMYLRDTTSVVSAIQEAKAGNDKKAMEFLEAADEPIQRVAEFWGFEYITICDLVESTPDGHIFIVGPFCGGFSPKDQSNSFVGVAFKGTSSQQEWATDIDRSPQATGSDSILWGTNVSAGIFSCLFGTYGDWGVPMDYIVGYIQSCVCILPEGSNQLMAHVTGHSLGASYATLAYAQLLQYQSTKPVEWMLGDLYTYGSPRVGENNFASQLRIAMGTAPGSIWRLVDQEDSVTALPPAPAHLFMNLPLVDDPSIYIHVDAACRISRSEAPVPLLSEIGLDPGPPPQTTNYLKDEQHMQDHSPWLYWAALLVASGITPM